MVEFTVTVPGGTGGGYYIDGVQKPIVPVVTGGTFRFNQNAANNNGHPLILSSTTSTAGIISTGVSYYLDGASNQANYTNTTLFNAATVRYIEITIAQTADFYYICNVHGSGMGNVMDITGDTWGALGWNIGEWGDQNDVDVLVTGQLLTASLNSVTPLANANIDVTSQLLTASLNSVTAVITVDINVSVTGNTLDIDTDHAWGELSWNNSSVTWGGSSGSVSIAIGAQVDVATQLLSLTLGNIDPSPDVAVTGIQLTTAIGAVDIDPDAVVTGQLLNLTLASVQVDVKTEVELGTQLLTLTLGDIDPSPDVAVTGSQITLALGVVNIDSVVVTGSQLNTSISSVTAIANADVFPTGQQLTTSVNSVNLTGSGLVILTGNLLTTSVNSINIQNWTTVNTGTIVTWTEINTAA